MTRLLASVALVTALACTASDPPMPTGVYAPEALRDVATRGVKRWYRATGLQPGYVAIGIGACADSDRLGTYDIDWQEIVICAHTYPARYEATIVHELGHALGAMNHHGSDGLMKPTLAESDRCITAADVDLICKYRACRWRVPESCDGKN